MRKFLLFSWLPLSLFTLGLALNLLNNSRTENNSTVVYAAANLVDPQAQVLGAFTSTVSAADARPELIRRYLDKYKSPLLPYSDFIVSVSDKYGLDFRLIVAIAQCESNVCKVIPDGSYNCWGFGNAKTRFNSWEHALEFVAKTLKEDYYNYGLITPEQMMPKYVPPSVAKGGPWAKCVNQFMTELQ